MKINDNKSVLGRKITNRKVLATKKYTVEIKESNQVNPLHHENIHFKNSYDKEKRNLFLS